MEFKYAKFHLFSAWKSVFPAVYTTLCYIRLRLKAVNVIQETFNPPSSFRIPYIKFIYGNYNFSKT